MPPLQGQNEQYSQLSLAEAQRQDTQPYTFSRHIGDTMRLPAVKSEDAAKEKKKKKQKKKQVVNVADSSEADTEDDGSVVDTTMKTQIKREKMTPEERRKSQQKQARRNPVNLADSSQADTDEFDSDGNEPESKKQERRALERLAVKIEADKTPKELQKNKDRSVAAAAAAANPRPDVKSEADAEWNAKSRRLREEYEANLRLEDEERLLAAELDRIKRQRRIDAMRREIKKETLSHPAPASSAAAAASSSSGGLGRDRLAASLNQAGMDVSRGHRRVTSVPQSSAAAAFSINPHSDDNDNDVDSMRPEAGDVDLPDVFFIQEEEKAIATQAMWTKHDDVFRKKREASAAELDEEDAAKRAKHEEEIAEIASYFDRSDAAPLPLFTGAAAYMTGVAHTGSALFRATQERLLQAARDTKQAVSSYASVADVSNIATATALATAVATATAMTEATIHMVAGRSVGNALSRPLRMAGTAIGASLLARPHVQYSVTRIQSEAPAAAGPASAAAAAAASSSSSTQYMTGSGFRIGGSVHNPPSRDERGKILEDKLKKPGN